MLLTAPTPGCPADKSLGVPPNTEHGEERRPTIIQGGMGVGVSGWRLARAVALAGQLGVVSGLGLDTLMARRLQLGDPGGHITRALAHFPRAGVAEQILGRYLVPGGIGPRGTFRPAPRPTLRPGERATQLAVAASFVEVFLAKEGHQGLVGVKLMEKLQMSTPAATYGAMLAGVDYVLVGAGIPAEFPALLGSLAAGRPGRVSVSVEGAEPTSLVVRPEAVVGAGMELRRPQFLAIVASHVLASYLARDPATRPDGFVVEGPSAGGHSAPPRGPLLLDEDGEPVYGLRDVADLDKVAALGLPYWLAGGYASPALLADAVRGGAAGVQVGSAFALCEESGLLASIKQAAIMHALAADLPVRADPRSSPTGFPFKLADLAGTVAEALVYDRRDRVCDVGYLRAAYCQPGARAGYRCPAEPVPRYVAKGGKVADTVGRCCLCNGLIAAIGLGQRRPDGTTEPPIVTLGQDLAFLRELLPPGRQGYTAADVVGYLLKTGPVDEAEVTVGQRY
jgi:NAD(P)H-dependent flavin oxidoreductase YrpB (nitropropane dioxygenase family)